MLSYYRFANDISCSLLPVYRSVSDVAGILMDLSARSVSIVFYLCTRMVTTLPTDCLVAVADARRGLLTDSPSVYGKVYGS